VPTLERVPWVELYASDEQTREPEIEFEETELKPDDLAERLEALGYA